MIAFVAVAAVAMQVAPAEAAKIQGMRWEGSAEVYPPRAVIKLGVRTRVQGDDVLSETWPVDEGEARGMHRMTLDANGGTIEIGGKRNVMTRAMWNEEHAQFGVYTQLQAAALRGPELARLGVNTLSVDGPVKTWFQIDRAGAVIGAVNQVPAGDSGRPAYQTFRFDGFWKSNGMVFPRHMEMTRDGKPFFTLDVAHFDAD
jgi:hypothetical protein